MLDHRGNQAQARSTEVSASVFSLSVNALGSMVSIAAACYSMFQPLKPQPNHAKATVAHATCHVWLDGNGCAVSNGADSRNKNDQVTNFIQLQFPSLPSKH